ncbi:MAG: hypothetical protein KKB25_02280, partial [Nanoarchaeota archaeon]|nr:hypothetical protein [Nanoarchaeota archaeon]
MKALIKLSLAGVSLTLIFAALFFAYIAPESVSATDVSACGDLDAANAVYVLTANVSAAGTCFNILAN